MWINKVAWPEWVHRECRSNRAKGPTMLEDYHSPGLQCWRGARQMWDPEDDQNPWFQLEMRESNAMNFSFDSRMTENERFKWLWTLDWRLRKVQPVDYRELTRLERYPTDQMMQNFHSSLSNKEKKKAEVFKVRLMVTYLLCKVSKNSQTLSRLSSFSSPCPWTSRRVAFSTSRSDNERKIAKCHASLVRQEGWRICRDRALFQLFG